MKPDPHDHMNREDLPEVCAGPDEPDYPFCECDLEPDEEEEASRRCKACGKPFVV